MTPADLATERFVSLTTFRRNGDGVPTPVWVARVGDALVVTTPSTTAKLKRLRNDPRVDLAPCSRSGKVAADATHVAATARIVADDDASGYGAAMLAKYGFQYRVALFADKLRKSSRRGRTWIAIEAAAG